MDLTTLHFTDALVNLTCGLMCFAIWASRPGDRCFAYWGLGGSLYGLTACWLPYLPDGNIGTGLTYSALQIANIMFWAGYRVFDGVLAVPGWLLGLPTIPLLTALAFGYPSYTSIFAEQATIVAYCAISLAQVGYVLKKSDALYSPRSISAYAVIVILLSVMLTGIAWNDQTQNDTHATLFILTDHAMTIVFMLAVIAMVGQRDFRSLVNASRRDPLTQALNRSGLDDLLSKIDTDAALLLIDVDHFKMINDRFGHAAGDEVLRALVNRIASVLPIGDHLVRLGGEEFLVISQPPDTLQAAALAERIWAAVRNESFSYEDAKIDFTVSIGCAWFASDEPFRQALKRADSAMYRAKRSGRDVIVEDWESIASSDRSCV
ncbi:GGDEF domain-containing protein [Pseudomonas sp. UBA6562]|uniref:GGDEF domain-containing protein n=1 Tax=Pseudomonas sp. UBA6562 TaxID=1947332 RepID=UPI0025EFDC18|nr:GGDEF domain-containing protein [Pseudomonas sp. UBA6562]